MQPQTAIPTEAQQSDQLPSLMPTDWAAIRGFHRVSNDISIASFNGYSDSDWSLSGASAPSFGIAVVLEGNCNMAFNGGPTLALKPGMVLLHSTEHVITGWDDFKGQQKIAMVDIRFTPEAIHQLCGHGQPDLRGRLTQDCSIIEERAYLGTIPAWRAISQVAAEILQCQSNQPAAMHLFLQAKAMESLALIIQHLGRPTSEPIKLTAVHRHRVNEVHEWIQHHYDARLTIKQIAQKVGLNEKLLQTGFMTLYGQSVHQCITQRRMDVAATLLKQGATVTEASGTVGFSSLSHFIKTFKEYWGATPKTWINHSI